MELVLLVVLLVATGVGAFVLGKQARREDPPRPAVRPILVERNRPARDAQSRAFQTALLQLAGTPDFRRAVTVAAAARLVPVKFRRRQFVRFRPAFVEHYRRCVTAGGDETVLNQSLTDLVTALALAAFEADYIRAVAEQTIRARGRSNARGGSKTTTASATNGTSRSVTRKQQLVPVLDTREVVTGVQFLPREEQAAMKGTALTRLPTGTALLSVTGASAVPVQFPLALDPFAQTPKYGGKKVGEHRVLREAHPAFATPAVIEAERQARIEALVRTVYAFLDAGGFGRPQPLLAHGSPDAEPIPLSVTRANPDDPADTF